MIAPVPVHCFSITFVKGAVVNGHLVGSGLLILSELVAEAVCQKEGRFTYLIWTELRQKSTHLVAYIWPSFQSKLPA